jgi:hypothetical protein
MERLQPTPVLEKYAPEAEPEEKGLLDTVFSLLEAHSDTLFTPSGRLSRSKAAREIINNELYTPFLANAELEELIGESRERLKHESLDEEKLKKARQLISSIYGKSRYEREVEEVKAEFQGLFGIEPPIKGVYSLSQRKGQITQRKEEIETTSYLAKKHITEVEKALRENEKSVKERKFEIGRVARAGAFGIAIGAILLFAQDSGISSKITGFFSPKEAEVSVRLNEQQNKPKIIKSSTQDSAPPVAEFRQPEKLKVIGNIGSKVNKVNNDLVDGVDIKTTASPNRKREVSISPETIVSQALGYGDIDFKDRGEIQIEIDLPNGSISGGLIEIKVGGDNRKLNQAQAFQTSNYSTVLGIHDGKDKDTEGPLEKLREYAEEVSLGERPDPQVVSDNLGELIGSRVKVIDPETGRVEDGILVKAKIADKGTVYQSFASMQALFGDLPESCTGRNCLFISTCSQTTGDRKLDILAGGEFYPGQIVFAIQKESVVEEAGKAGDDWQIESSLGDRKIARDERVSMQKWLSRGKKSKRARASR